MPARSEEFTITTRRRRWRGPVVCAQGRMTAAGGELLYCTLTAAQRIGNPLRADLTGVSQIDPAGWAWLALARQECEASGCELRIVPTELRST